LKAQKQSHFEGAFERKDKNKAISDFAETNPLGEANRPKQQKQTH